MRKNIKNGYTLIEVLIVISIIGLITYLLTINISAARMKSRDAMRISDLDDFSGALALYYDQYRLYPCGDSFIETGAYPMFVDADVSCPFLDGMDDGVDCGIDSHEESAAYLSYCPNTQPLLLKRGIYSNNLYSNYNRREPLKKANVWYYYTALPSRKSYTIRVKLENNNDKMANDGGLCKCFYEVGPGKNDIKLLSPYSAPNKDDVKCKGPCP